MRLEVALIVLVVAGCDAPPLVSDGGAPVDASALAEPSAPALPSFLPCPEGWTEALVEDGAFAVCEPPSGDPCPPGQVRFVDSSECVPAGDPCPSGDFAAPPPGSGAVYVRAGASGDGSMASPYGSIQLAIQRAPPGAVVLVAKGTYDEAIDLYGGVRVIGACAAETILAPSAGVRLDARYAVRAAELGSGLANVTLRPSAALSGVHITGELTLEGVVMDGVSDAGALVEGGSLTARALVVRDVAVTTDLFGRAIAAEDATVSIERAIFERCPGGGIVASTGASVSARAIVVRDSGQGIAGGPQLLAQGGGVLDVAGSLLEDAVGTGLVATNGGVLRADQLVIRRMRRDAAAGMVASGALLRSGSRLEGRRLRVEDVDVFGLGFVEGAAAELEDFYVARVARTDLEAGFALTARGDLVVRRGWLSGAETVGLLSDGRGVFDLEDLSVSDSGSTAHYSNALSLLDARGSIRRVHVRGVRGAGLVAYGEAADLTLEDVRVEDVEPGQDLMRGRGIEVRDGAFRIARARVERTREVGVLAYYGAALEVTDLAVRDTRERACAETTCAGAPGGSGLASVDARVSVRRFALVGARLCGAQVAGEGELSLEHGEIASALVGACVQRDGYDVSEITTGVVFRDNGVNVDATSHSVPPPSDPLPAIDL